MDLEGYEVTKPEYYIIEEFEEDPEPIYGKSTKKEKEYSPLEEESFLE